MPAYAKFVQERFERCLDLYLCPRARKKRLNVDPDSLLPKLPKPKDLMPFPTWQSLLVRTHLASTSTLIRCSPSCPSPKTPCPSPPGSPCWCALTSPLLPRVVKAVNQVFSIAGAL